MQQCIDKCVFIAILYSIELNINRDNIMTQKSNEDCNATFAKENNRRVLAEINETMGTLQSVVIAPFLDPANYPDYNNDCDEMIKDLRGIKRAIEEMNEKAQQLLI